MSRPFTRRQSAQNARFLAALRRTGNARLAARDLGVHRATYTKRRAAHPAFAAAWDEALTTAHATLHQDGEASLPEASSSLPGRDCQSRTKTQGGEPAIIRLKSGRLQLRLSPPGRMTQQAWDIALRALENTNNLRLAAEAAGVAHSSLLARARANPAAARAIAAARAEARGRIDRQERARQKRARLARLPREYDDDAPLWPPGLTMAQALHALGAPPLKLPGMPFPAKRPASSAPSAKRSGTGSGVRAGRPARRGA